MSDKLIYNFNYLFKLDTKLIKKNLISIYIRHKYTFLRKTFFFSIFIDLNWRCSFVFKISFFCFWDIFLKYFPISYISKHISSLLINFVYCLSKNLLLIKLYLIFRHDFDIQTLFLANKPSGWKNWLFCFSFSYSLANIKTYPDLK